MTSLQRYAVYSTSLLRQVIASETPVCAFHLDYSNTSQTVRDTNIEKKILALLVITGLLVLPQKSKTEEHYELPSF